MRLVSPDSWTAAVRTRLWVWLTLDIVGIGTAWILSPPGSWIPLVVALGLCLASYLWACHVNDQRNDQPHPSS